MRQQQKSFKRKRRGRKRTGKEQKESKWAVVQCQAGWHLGNWIPMWGGKEGPKINSGWNSSKFQENYKPPNLKLNTKQTKYRNTRTQRDITIKTLQHNEGAVRRPSYTASQQTIGPERSRSCSLLTHFRNAGSRWRWPPSSRGPRAATRITWPGLQAKDTYYWTS